MAAWKSTSLLGCKTAQDNCVCVLLSSFPWCQDSFLAPDFLEIVRYCTSPDADLHGLLRYIESFSGKENNSSATKISTCDTAAPATTAHFKPWFNHSDLTHSRDKQDVIFCLTRVSGEAGLCSSCAPDEILISAFPVPGCPCLTRGSGCSRAGVLVPQPLGEPAERTLLVQGAWFSLPKCFNISDNPCG